MIQNFRFSPRLNDVGGWDIYEALDVVHLVPLLYTLHITEADPMAFTKRKKKREKEKRREKKRNECN